MQRSCKKSTASVPPGFEPRLRLGTPPLVQMLTLRRRATMPSPSTTEDTSCIIYALSPGEKARERKRERGNSFLYNFSTISIISTGAGNKRFSFSFRENLLGNRWITRRPMGLDSMCAQKSNTKVLRGFDFAVRER